jgi:hypothetical protein
MCKKSYHRTSLVSATAGAYEGQTRRLTPAATPHPKQRPRGWKRGFPWWSLWLIWPLAGLARSARPLTLAALDSFRLGAGLLDRAAVMLVAGALICTGAALIWRSQTSNELGSTRDYEPTEHFE